MTRTGKCSDCGETFPVETTKGRLPARCETCKRAHAAARQREWRAANPERSREIYARNNAKRLADPDHRRRKREAAILRTYGLDGEAYAALLAAQSGRCAICQMAPGGKANGRARPDLVPSLHVDHRHGTSRVRGLLCSNCNTLLGLAREDVDVLARAIEYLQKE